MFIGRFVDKRDKLPTAMINKETKQQIRFQRDMQLCHRLFPTLEPLGFVNIFGNEKTFYPSSFSRVGTLLDIFVEMYAIFVEIT